MEYRPDIDGLRAIAIILVVIFHAFPAALPGGFVGVDIFFVISGYLISGVILYRLKKGSFTFAGFYRRRILRIFPALIALLLAALIAGWFLLWPEEYKALGKHVAGGASFISNIILYQEIGYFDTAAYGKFLLNLWSLGIEEQFYFVFPLLLWLLYRYPVITAPFLFLVCLLSFGDNIWLAGVHPGADFYLPLSRFWELLAGAVLQAFLHPELRPAFLTRGSGGSDFKNQLKIWLLTLASLVFLILALLICKNDEGNYPGFAALLPVACAVCIIAAGPSAPFNRLLLASNGAVYLGKISYTLYLWHWPLLSFAWTLMGRDAYEAAPGVRAGLVLAAVILASLTFHFIEQPIRFGSLFGKFKVVVLASSMFLLFLAGLLVWHNNGIVQRLPASEYERYSQLSIPDAEDDACLEYTGAKSGDFAYCRHSGTSFPVTVALLGDSHAQSAFYGLAEAGKKHGFNTLLLGRFLKRGDDKEEIDRQNAEILKIVKGRKDIGPIVIVLRGAGYLHTEHNPGDLRRDQLFPRDELAVSADLEAFLGELATTGKPILVIEDNPDLNTDIRLAIPRKILFSSTKPLYAETPLAEATERQAAYNRILDRAEKIPGVKIIRGTMDLFSRDGLCLLLDEGDVPLYFDDDHLSRRGSAKLAEKIILPALRTLRYPGLEATAQKSTEHRPDK